MLKHAVAGAVMVTLAAGSASAQSAPADAEQQLRARQRIATMEAVLARAVSNGADRVIREWREVMSDRPTLAGAPQARGFRLEGQGLFFDVEVPLLRLPLTWPLRYMTRQDVNTDALRTLQRLRAELGRVQGDERVTLERMVAQLERDLGAASPIRPATPPGARGSVSAATVSSGPVPVPDTGNPAAVVDPENTYTSEVKEALIDAMLEGSGTLVIGPEEWLWVAARDNAPRDPLIPGDTTDFSTWIFRVKGSDLSDFRAGRITAEEARTRVEVREY
jgi:hypothetical protein